MDASIKQRISDIITADRVVLFMKGSPSFPMCGFSGRAVQILKAQGVQKFHHFDVLSDQVIREGIKTYANWPTIPQLYINGEFIGGCDIMAEMHESGELKQVLAKLLAA